MTVLTKKSLWLNGIALGLLLGCDQRATLITPVQQGSISQEGESSTIPLHQAVPQGGDVKAGGKEMSLVQFLSCWDYKDSGMGVLGYLATKDKGHLRATWVEMGWMLLHKEALNVSLTADRLQAMRLPDYPRLYPHTKNDAHCVCLTFQPVPRRSILLVHRLLAPHQGNLAFQMTLNALPLLLLQSLARVGFLLDD
jgi:hypothetical protein